MKFALLGILLVTPFLLAPQAAAWPTCGGSDGAVIAHEGAFYVRVDRLEGQVWQESNGVPGLQIDHCIDADGHFQLKDTVVVDTGVLPPPCIGVNPLCLGPGPQ